MCASDTRGADDGAFNDLWSTLPPDCHPSLIRAATLTNNAVYIAPLASAILAEQASTAALEWSQPADSTVITGLTAGH